jgi:hypothetical protein
MQALRAAAIGGLQRLQTPRLRADRGSAQSNINLVNW